MSEAVINGKGVQTGSFICLKIEKGTTLRRGFHWDGRS
jgi:hypothetical protein